MTVELCLIDTDILSYILKRIEPAYEQSRLYLNKRKNFSVSCLTYYECYRGYKAVGATARMETFRELLKLTDVLYLDQFILEKAGEIYGILKNNGVLPGELDILIAATAIVKGYSLVTNNTKHYEIIQKYFPLTISNWMKQ